MSDLTKIGKHGGKALLKIRRASGPTPRSEARGRLKLLSLLHALFPVGIFPIFPQIATSQSEINCRLRQGLRRRRTPRQPRVATSQFAQKKDNPNGLGAENETKNCRGKIGLRHRNPNLPNFGIDLHRVPGRTHQKKAGKPRASQIENSRDNGTSKSDWNVPIFPCFLALFLEKRPGKRTLLFLLQFYGRPDPTSSHIIFIFPTR